MGKIEEKVIASMSVAELMVGYRAHVSAHLDECMDGVNNLEEAARMSRRISQPSRHFNRATRLLMEVSLREQAEEKPVVGRRRISRR